MSIIQRVARLAIEEREVKKYPWVAFCDEPTCYFIVSARNVREANESIVKHKCPYGGSPDRIPGKPLLSAMWRELDASMDAIMLARTHTDPILIGDQKVEHHKSRAGGIATCLFICLGGAPGYYETQDDITREAVRRYKMRIGELAWEPTQGDNYDALRDSPTPRWEAVVTEMRRKGAEVNSQITPPPNRAPVVPHARRVPTTRARSTAPSALVAPPVVMGGDIPSAPSLPPVPVVSPGAMLPPDVEQGIRNGLKSGLFQHKQLAAMYGVSPSVVAALDS